MNILHAGTFRDHCLDLDCILKTGFIKNPVAYREFDYRAISGQDGPEKMNRQLAEAAKGCDLVFIGKGELITPSTLALIRKTGSCVAICYGDMRPIPPPWLMNNLKECDVLFLTSAGETLKSYFREGRPGRAAFFFNPSNPDLVADYADIPRSVDPPLFTGARYRFMGEERRSVYKYLCRQKNIQIFGSPHVYFEGDFLRRIYCTFKPVKHIRDREYIEKIIRCRLGVGVSGFQQIKYYTSNRLSDYLTFGKLYLAYHFPGCEDFFQDGVHIVYYRSVQDLDAQIKFYLRNRDLAEEIGKRGQEKMLSEYSAGKMVKMMLEIIATGRSDAFPWVEVYS